MSVIKIPFNDWSIDRLLTGNKCATSRNKKYGRKGDIFYVHSMIKGDDSYINNIVFDIAFEIVSIEYLKLMTVAYTHYKEEGCTGSQEFITMWTDLHPETGFIPSNKVYFHKFLRID